jgi:predicted nucleic acid-binding protein
MTDSKPLIDTNILVYSIDRSSSKQEKAREIMRAGFEGKEDYYVSLQNLEELAVVSTSKIDSPLKWEEIYGYIEEISKLRNFKLLPTSENAILESLKIRENSSTDYWDSVIAAVMKQNKVEKIYTENVQDFQDINGIRAENPLE